MVPWHPIPDAIALESNVGTPPSPNTTVGLNFNLSQGSNPPITYGAIRAGEDTGVGMGFGSLRFLTQKYNGASVLTERMRISSAGRIGIGTTSPDFLFQIHDANMPTIAIGKLNQNTNGKSRLQFFAGDGTVANGFSIDYFKSSFVDRLGFADGGGVERISILNGGNVGIGTTNPTQKLEVNGTVYSREVKVDLAAGTGPDYVFEKDYNLPSLESVKTYIDQNKHLPEVPSAKEMEANGINLGEMNMLLLKKVEELTLHLIDQSRKGEQMRNEQASAVMKIEELTQRLINQQKEIEELKRVAAYK